MGNSEVGHQNIGAGRVVEQELLKISRAIEHDKLAQLQSFVNLIDSTKHSKGNALHIIGLLSHGGVHSSLRHVTALVKEAIKLGVTNIIIHAITDGRDTSPQAAYDEIGSFISFLDECKKLLPVNSVLQIGSIIGRYFAMDRDNRWDRTQKAYDLYTLGKGTIFDNPITALETQKQSGVFDEFIEPISIKPINAKRLVTISDNDAVLFANFRADRMRQIVRAITDDSFNSFNREVYPKLNNVCTLTQYDKDLSTRVLFEPDIVKNHFGQVLSNAGLKQLRIAETEKYPHVTYFFNGGAETPVKGESRILIPSPRDVPTYDHKPEMSAFEVTEALIEQLRSGMTDVIIVNFANCDMVGHTGSFEAAVIAVETVDKCLGMVLNALYELQGVGIVTADHGNAEQMIDYNTGQVHTAHTTYPVPFFLVGEALSKLNLISGGALCDIAPTACEILGLMAPNDMTGESLISKS
jgi:2,3-bisphosphoglycerate-independent phosphoglycerate mutase